MKIGHTSVNNFIINELSLLNELWPSIPAPDYLFESTSSIAWVTKYFKDSITNKTSNTIINLLDDIYHSNNYKTCGWYRVPFLEAAVFIITGDNRYFNKLLNKISCMQSWARNDIIRGVGYLINDLKFDNYLLREETEINLKNKQAYSFENLILYLCAQGSQEAKRLWIEKTQKEIPFVKELIEKERINSGEIFCNFYNSTFNKAKTFFLFKLFELENIGYAENSIFYDEIFNFNRLIELEQTNPLNHCLFDFPYMEK